MAIEEQLVPIAAIIFVTIIVSIAIYSGHKRDMEKDKFNHERDMALIEKGTYEAPPTFTQKTLMGLLIAGLISVGIGAAVFMGVYWEIGLGAWSIAGLVPCFIGIALLISRLFIKEKE